MSIKVVFVGNDTVGKTCFLNTYITNVFPYDYVPTVFDNYSANVLYNNKSYNVDLWDTGGGGESYYRLRPLSYPQTDVFVICFSVSHKSTFSAILDNWYPEIKAYSPHTPIVLVGLKSDIRLSKRYREGDYASYYPMELITQEQTHEMARKIGAYAYVECSSLYNINLRAVVIAALSAFNHSKPNETKPKVKKGNSIIGAIKKKFKKVTIPESEPHTEDSTVVNRVETFSPYSRYAHAAIYDHFDSSSTNSNNANDINNNNSENNDNNNTQSESKQGVYIFGGYTNLQNELASHSLFWNGEEDQCTIIESDASVFAPRSFLCATLIHSNSSFSSPSSPSSQSSSSSSSSPFSIILLFGGKSNGYHNDTIAFDTATHTFQKLEVTGKVPTPRYGMTAVTYKNEMIIFGGFDNDSSPCNDCWKFNYERREWTKFELSGEVPSPRFFHTSVFADEFHTMLVYGGKSGVIILQDFFIVDLRTGACKEIKYDPEDSNPGPRQNHTSVYMGHGNMAVIGGMTSNKLVSDYVYMYSLETYRWTTVTVKGVLPPIQCHSSFYFALEDEIWICGGKGDEDSIYLMNKLKITNMPKFYDVLPKQITQYVFSFFTTYELSKLSTVSRQFNTFATGNILSSFSSLFFHLSIFLFLLSFLLFLIFFPHYWFSFILYNFIDSCLCAAWEAFAKELYPKYNSATDGEPRSFCRNFYAPSIWFNDFTQNPVPAPFAYVKYGSPDFVWS